MGRIDAFEEGMDRPLAMAAEAVRRHASREAGIPHDAPEAPQVTDVRPQDPNRDRYTPEASHHVTVTHEEPPKPGRQLGTTHRRVYGVNTQSEYMHPHTHVHELHDVISPATNQPTTITKFTP
jgi:hypothetical protein